MKSRTLLFVAAFVCACTLGQAQINPTFNPEKGEKYTYRQVTEQEISQSVAGQEIAMSIATEMLTEMNVRDKNSSEVSVDYVYKEIVMTLLSDMMSFKVDTKNKTDNMSDIEKMGASLFGCIIGKTLQVVVTPDGSVKSVTGFNAILDDMKKIMAPLGDIEQQMSSVFVQSFNDESLKNTFQQIFKIYPGKEVKTGESWSNENSFENAGMSNNVKNTFTFKSVSNDVALIDLTSEQTVKSGAGMEGEMKGEVKGDMRLNVKTGMPVQTSSEGNVKGKLSAQGMEVSMDITTKTSVTLQ